MTDQILASIQPEAKPEPARLRVLALVVKLRTFIALILVLAFFGAMAPNFVAVDNVVIIGRHVAINALLAIGMTFVILTAGIDLSVGSIVGLAGMVGGYLLTRGVPLHFLHLTIYPSVPAVIAMVIGVGVLIGAVNGLLVTRLSVAPFIATLGTMFIARGAALLISGGEP